MRAKIVIHTAPELKTLLSKAADREGTFGGMGEYIVRLLAEHFKRPDLAFVPRKRFGRPPKEALTR